MGVVCAIFGVIALAIAFRVMAGGLDHGRVEDYVRSRGGQVIEAHWSPFGPGWFGEKSDRIYEVRYLDSEGNERVAHCKTSMLSGVYFTDDQIVRRADRPERAEPDSRSLEEENRRLREEIERLRRGQG